MATVKYNEDEEGNKRIILKGGKVSCSCCDTCCMYSAEFLASEEYTEDDLPDAVTVDGVSYLRSGTRYGNTTNGVILEGSDWAKYSSGARSTRPCLIQGGVKDQFADTYTVKIGFNDGDYGPFYNTYIATRISLCYWDAGIITDIPQNIGKALALIYDPAERLIAPGFGVLIGNEPGSIPFTKQDPPESNTPVGIYDADSPIFLIEVL